MEHDGVHQGKEFRNHDEGLPERNPVFDAGLHHGQFGPDLGQGVMVVQAGQDGIARSSHVHGRHAISILGHGPDMDHPDVLGILRFDGLDDIPGRLEVDFFSQVGFPVGLRGNQGHGMQAAVDPLACFCYIFLFESVSPDDFQSFATGNSTTFKGLHAGLFFVGSEAFLVF